MELYPTIHFSPQSTSYISTKTPILMGCRLMPTMIVSTKIRIAKRKNAIPDEGGTIMGILVVRPVNTLPFSHKNLNALDKIYLSGESNSKMVLADTRP